jgi:MFS family permease
MDNVPGLDDAGTERLDHDRLHDAADYFGRVAPMRAWPTGGLWRHGDFLRLWSAETISQFGTQVSNLAIPLVAILILDATAFEVAALGTVLFLPFIIFTLPAGVWVDRMRRKPILVAGDLGRAALLATIPLAYFADALTLWQLYVVGFLVGVCTVFFDVAYQSYLPSLVEREQLVEGNSKLEISRSASQIAGPGFAGILIEVVTAPYAVLVDALSFLGSGLFILGIRKDEEIHVERNPEKQTSFRAELKAGLRFVLGNPYLRAQAGCTATSNFFFSLGFSIILVYLVRVLDLSPGVIGVVLSLGSIGSLVAAFTAMRISGRFGVGPTAIAAAVLQGPGFLLVAVAPADSPIPFLVAAQLVLGFAIVAYNIMVVSFRQALCPERLLGRMNSVMRFIVWGTIPLGNLAGGALATWVGLRETIVVGAIGGGLAFFWLLLSPMRHVREMPTEPMELAGEPTPA